MSLVNFTTREIAFPTPDVLSEAAWMPLLSTHTVEADRQVRPTRRFSVP